MKKIIVMLLAFLLAAFPAVGEGFALQNGIHWGASIQDVADIEGDAVEAATRAGFDLLKLSDSKHFGYVCEIEYCFRGDSLLACVYEYTSEAGADPDEIEALVTSEYGAPIVPDPERWMLMRDILDGEMADRPVSRFACWQLDDGTLITLVSREDDPRIELGFFDEMKLVEGML